MRVAVRRINGAPPPGHQGGEGRTVIDNARGVGGAAAQVMGETSRLPSRSVGGLWTVGQMEAVARRHTGLADFGPTSYREPLEVLLESLRSEARLTNNGTALCNEMLTGSLATRLTVQAWGADHPEVLRLEVARPVIVIGQPRTGTTLLSYLLAEDPASRTLRTWEADRPVPPPRPETYTTDPRIALSAADIEHLERMVPGVQAIHRQEADGPTECLSLLGLDFRNPAFPTQWNCPRYADWLRAADFSSAYALHRTVLQLLQSAITRRRWMLKSPAHTLALEAMVRTYPDALFVVTHRDPVKSVTSTASLMKHYRPIFSDRVDAFECGRQALFECGVMCDRFLDFVDRHGEDRVCHLHYRELVDDPVAAVNHIYTQMGEPLEGSMERKIREYVRNHPRNEHGRHRYQPADFGLRAEEIRERFHAYIARFAVPVEEH